MAKSKTCPYADERRECESTPDAETDDGLCADHSGEWRSSKEFSEALRDDKVRGWMQLGLPKKAMAEVNKHKRRWLKRMRTPAGESSPE